MVFLNTLSPAYNEFGYYAHLALTSKFIPQKRTLPIDINVQKFGLNEYCL